jgi:hypothetical protein
VTAAEAPREALASLIAYIRNNYAPTAPTALLLAAYEVQAAELSQLRAEIATLRQCLALSNADPTDAQVEGWRMAADEERH